MISKSSGVAHSAADTPNLLRDGCQGSCSCLGRPPPCGPILSGIHFFHNVVCGCCTLHHLRRTGALDCARRLNGDAKLGVGIRGMHERIRQLDGDLDITSGRQGTVVVARLPTASVSSTADA